MGKRKLTEFGKTVKIKMIKKEMNTKELAEKIGTSGDYLHQILYGVKAPGKYYEKIIKELEMDKEIN